MIKIAIVISLLTAMSYAAVFDMNYSYYKEDEIKDYDCVHENHSQYDDGDSENLDFLNKNYNLTHY